jgi:CheY-like chemotaxis protein
MLQMPLTILIADDDKEDLELIEDAFLNNRFNDLRLHKLTDGNKVLDYLDTLKDEELPCLIILDYNMPEMKGSEVISQLSNQPRYKTIPKVILSTSNAPGHIHECKSKGAADYFVKPTTMNELNMVAKKMLSYCKHD